MIDNLITISIVFTEVTTLIVLGLLIFMILCPVYDWVKKNMKIEVEKKQKPKQEYDWVAIFDEMFERSEENAKRRQSSEETGERVETS